LAALFSALSELTVVAEPLPPPVVVPPCVAQPVRALVGGQLLPVPPVQLPFEQV
jgi:hypothetical protein